MGPVPNSDALARVSHPAPPPQEESRSGPPSREEEETRKSPRILIPVALCHPTDFFALFGKAELAILKELRPNNSWVNEVTNALALDQNAVGLVNKMRVIVRSVSSVTSSLTQCQSTDHLFDVCLHRD